MKLSLKRLDPPQPWLRRWLSIARWHNATLELTEEGFVRLTVAGRSVTKRNLASFDFNDLPGKPC